jgi:hypothetical protein
MSRSKSTLLIAILALSTIFFLLLFLMEKFPQWNEVLRDIALAVGPLVIFTLIWEYLLQSSRNEEIKSLITSVLNDQFSDIDKLHKSGLIQIHPSISNEELRDFIEGAQHSLRVLVPWFVEPNVLKETLKRKAHIPGFNMKMILLEPSSKFLSQRGKVIQPSQPMYGQQESQKSLLALYESLNDSNPVNIQVLVYDSLPSVFIVEVDNVALLGLHLNTAMALQNPHFEIQVTRDGEKTILGSMIQKELDKVLIMSHVVDIGTVKQDKDGNFAYEVI